LNELHIWHIPERLCHALLILDQGDFSCRMTTTGALVTLMISNY
jgi:hypothetical protein